VSFFSGPDWTCPHCGKAGIRWADKMRCASYGTRCQCNHCKGFSREAPNARSVNSVLFYVAYLVIWTLGIALVLHFTMEGSGITFAVGLLLLGGIWLLIRHANIYYSALSIPLVPIYPSPRWEKFKSVAGVVIGTSMLVVLALSLILGALHR